MPHHEWQLDTYTVALAISARNVTGLNDFRTISFETVRMGLRRKAGTLWFWSGEPAHGGLPTADSIGYFRDDYLHAFLDPVFFDGAYALLRMEWPVLLHFAEDEGSVWSVELIARGEPVGEADRSARTPDFFSVGDLVADLESAARQ